ncbi:sigma-70 family RNA polymerase sigma factor [Streptococcus ruminantium]|uniref:Sigma-70 family RNA polymerase sigma factor n=1 Tax=Streptococcus ruminantium TaxID=1917441 RepID=A0A2Z5TK23_9STRE|nr:sigma-70 family RNA polymerase sigma factor [Streptococcus ruminantium]BBA91770.1 sigma-70 family RNA polymerase sigma factor [Streptococcus ruminantium]
MRQKLRQFSANLSPEEAKEYSKIISGQSSPAQASILHSLYEYLEQED